MPPIFINTDNNDKTNKIYVANSVGEGAAEAEDKMKAMVIKAFEKSAEFTTNKIENPKGYTLSFKVTKFDASGGDTSCTIKGEILRFPKSVSKSKQSDGSGTEKVMTSGEWSGSAKASGKGKGAMLDCVEAIMESMIPKSIPVMKADMTRR
jgi:hypothetical protein